jgi:hypothetical protein
VHRSHGNIQIDQAWCTSFSDGPVGVRRRGSCAVPNKKDDLHTGGRPTSRSFSSSDVDDRDDPVVAINDDDLIADDEVHVPAPLGMDLDERRGNRHHMHVTWHGGANADGEVDVVDARHIAAGQHRLPNLRALLRGQADAAARLTLLRLTLLSLPLLRSLAWLSLTWLTGLALLRRLTCLAIRCLLLAASSDFRRRHALSFASQPAPVPASPARFGRQGSPTPERRSSARPDGPPQAPTAQATGMATRP